MTIEFVFIFMVIAFVCLIIFFVVMFRKFKLLTMSQNHDQGLTMLHQSVQSIQHRLDQTNQTISARLDHASKMFGDVNRELGHLKELGGHMRDLQDFLKSPKLRGNLGELVLRDLLTQVFSKHQFMTQYKFKEGAIVDAVIKTDRGLVSIDSKFPMENFQRMMKEDREDSRLSHQREFMKDIKRHINDISSKYIVPGEGTCDFAIMYIPNEVVYYELIRQEEDLNSYAVKKRVFPVSPNSFYYFLRVLLMGMEGKKIEEGAKRIFEALLGIQKDAEKFHNEMNVLNTHMTNTRSAYERVMIRFGRFIGKVENIRLLNSEDKPSETREKSRL